MSSSLCAGWLTHQRRDAPGHGFRYALYMLLLDLDELPSLAARLRLFGCNRRRPVAFYDRDHLGDPGRPARANLEALLAAHGIHAPAGRILLLTHARVFGYVFNPISVFYCFDPEDRLVAAVAEVSNTFGERHPYVLEARDGGATWHEKKLLHVSPFFSMQGSYRFHLPVPSASGVEARVDLWHGDRLALAARLSLDRRPLTDAALARALCRYPFITAQVVAGIHWQAFRLWRKGAPVFSKPPYDPAAARRESA
jgi:DUF1365 family protein